MWTGFSGSETPRKAGKQDLHDLQDEQGNPVNPEKSCKSCPNLTIPTTDPMMTSV
jgi:hypothetical protein